MSDGLPTLGSPTRAELIRSGMLEEWIAQVRAGDSTALGRLFDQCQAPVFALALRIARDRHVAEEVLLDVFLQVWRQASHFDPRRGPAYHWLLTLARSRALDAVRSRTVRSRREADAAPLDPAADPAARPLEAAVAVDRASAVRSAIQTLPADQAAVIELAYDQDLSHTEIAARLGLPLGTIKTRIRLGMLKLRDKLRVFEDES